MAVEVKHMMISEARAMQLCKRIRQNMTDARNDLLELYEGEGWRSLGYSSWRECVTTEFGEHERTLYRQLQAAKVVREIERTAPADEAVVQFDTCVKNKVSERKLRQLAKAPEGTRAEVLGVAVEASGGEPSEAVVKAAVDAKWAKPEATPDELVKTVVNGVAKADAAVEKARARGSIPAGVTVVVEDPGEDETRIEDVAEEHVERASKAEDLTDDEWLGTLPLHGKLQGVSLDVFRRDALLWRRMQPPFRTYASHARIQIKTSRKGTARSTEGPYAANLSWHLRFQDPSRWLICPPMDKGGCGGSGRISLGPCPMCKERGYLAR